MAHGLEAAWVANAKKDKGDRAERAALAYLRIFGFANAERTRAGYERDAGDIHLEPGGLIIAQVKDHKTPRWTEWLTQLREQVTQAKARHGFLLVKRPRFPVPGEWLAVMALSDFIRLLRDAGYGEYDVEASDYPDVSRAGEAFAQSFDAVFGEGVSRDPGRETDLRDDQNKESD